MSDKKVDIDNMCFRELLTGLYNVDFLLEEELETICRAAELYAAAKAVKFIALLSAGVQDEYKKELEKLGIKKK